jgi:CRP/FNR family transcriptional regulator
MVMFRPYPFPSSDPRAVFRQRDPGPDLVAIPFREPTRGRARALLSPEERDALGGISTHFTVRKGDEVYREGDAAGFLYIITTGYVRTERAQAAGPAAVTGFHAAGDLLGLAAEGRYVESARAIATSSAYRVPLEALESLLRSDGALSLRLLCKLASVMAAEQRHAMILARRGALARIAMFLEMLEGDQRERGRDTELVYLPMSRANIAAYVGLSIEAVSRAFGMLQARGVVTFRNKRQLRIANRHRLGELIRGRRGERPDAPPLAPS